MKIVPGYYAIKHEGFIVPAHFNGSHWRHGKDEIVVHESSVIHPLSLGCPTGCTCSTNSGGTINVNCHQE